MGEVHKFRGAPKRAAPRGNTGGKPPFPRKRRSSRWRWFGYPQAMIATLGISLGALAGIFGTGSFGTGILATQSYAQFGAADDAFACPSAQVIDGDTFDCGGQRIRLQGIDAPELPGHCRKGRTCTPGDPYASTENLRAMLGRGQVTCRPVDTDVYGRTVARCRTEREDLSCGQIAGGYAVRRYAVILCL